MTNNRFVFQQYCFAAVLLVLCVMTWGIYYMSKQSPVILYADGVNEHTLMLTPLCSSSSKTSVQKTL